MEIKKLQVLLKAVDEGSFLRAGEALDYSQSAITQMMNNLEQEMGFKLLLRNNKGVSLTAEGQQLMSIIRELLNVNERIEQQCAQIIGVERGTVRIGSITSMAIHWLPKIIHCFQQLHPQITIELLENGSVEILETWLAEGVIDIAFVSLGDKSCFEQLELMQDPLCAVLPQGHALQNAESVPVSFFADQPFIMWRSTSGDEVEIHKALSKHKIKPQISFSTNFDQIIVAMVANHLGVSILHQLILEGLAEDVVVKPLNPPTFRRLGIIARSFNDLSPAAKQFVEVSQEMLINASRSGDMRRR